MLRDIEEKMFQSEAQIKAFQPIREQTVSYNMSSKFESHLLQDRKKKSLKLQSDDCHGVTLSLPSQLQMMRAITAVWGPCEMCKLCWYMCVCVCISRASTRHLILCFSFIPASVAGCHGPISFNTLLHLLG